MCDAIADETQREVSISSVTPERAGAAAAVSETAYELGMALGIATLGSIVNGVYRALAIPPGTPDAVASHARDSLAASIQAAGRLPVDKAHGLLTAAKIAFTDGLAIAAGVGSALLLASAVAVWLLLRPPPTRPGAAEVGVLDDPGMHRDAGGDRCVDAAGGPNWAIDTVDSAPALPSSVLSDRIRRRRVARSARI